MRLHKCRISSEWFVLRREDHSLSGTASGLGTNSLLHTHPSDGDTNPTSGIRTQILVSTKANPIAGARIFVQNSCGRI